MINLFNKIANMKKVYNSIMLSVLLLSTVFMGTHLPNGVEKQSFV